MWEVSIVRDTAARMVVATDLAPEDIPAAMAEAWIKARKWEANSPTLRRFGVAVTRMDSTYEAKQAKWESEFYDITRNGSKRRRYKKPDIEREWEQWVKNEKKEQRERARRNNAGRGSGR